MPVALSHRKASMPPPNYYTFSYHLTMIIDGECGATAVTTWQIAEVLHAVDTIPEKRPRSAPYSKKADDLAASVYAKCNATPEAPHAVDAIPNKR
jgi:hypothetical protein